MEKFILIDGNAILHRAYHALPPLTNKEGIVTNAVYGFFSMFLKILQDTKPAYLAVCFDREKPNFRQVMYVGYHATRPKLQDDFVPQIQMVHKGLEDMGVPIFELDGYEADDMIGTLSVEGVKAKKDLQVIIVSGDRDMLQLVNGRVFVLMPIVGLSKIVLFDEEAVKEKYGISPSRFVDYKALIGDPSDNYPGVSGIGPKTASELLKKFDSFENLYRNLSELPPKISEKLAQDAEQAALAKKLAEIVKDAPIKLDLKVCSVNNFDMFKIARVLESMGFESLTKRARGEAVVRKVSKETKDAKDEKKSSSAKAKGGQGKDKKDEEQLGLL